MTTEPFIIQFAVSTDRSSGKVTDWETDDDYPQWLFSAFASCMMGTVIRVGDEYDDGCYDTYRSVPKIPVLQLSNSNNPATWSDIDIENDKGRYEAFWDAGQDFGSDDYGRPVMVGYSYDGTEWWHIRQQKG